MLPARLSVLICVFTLCGLLNVVVAQTFLSIQDVKSLYTAEGDICDDLERYVEQEEEKIQKVREKVEEIRSRRSKATGTSISTIVGHPVNVLNMIKNWYSPVTPTPPGMERPKQKLHQMQIRVPNDEDYNGALERILRLQQFYKMEVADLVDGVINGVRADGPLEPFDYWALGFKAYVMGEMGIAIQWLQMVIDEEPLHVPMTEAYSMLAQSYSKIGNYEKAADMAIKMHQRDPDNIETESKKDYFVAERDFKRARKDQPASQVTALNWRNPSLEPWVAKYRDLCRAANQIPERSAGERCRYKAGKLPYVTYKEEIFSADPYISMVYDVISSRQMEVLKNSADIAIKRGQKESGQLSNAAWVYDITEGVPALTAAISDVTGLSASYRSVRTSAEPYYVMNTGIGQTDDPHFDYLGTMARYESSLFLKGTGDRLATFSVILDEPTSGGHTVFSDLDLAIRPVKGAALFYYNILRSGEEDPRTIHNDCPILLGQKWVANKWMREYGQEFRHKCCSSPGATELEAENICV